ncbi:glycosyltransferase [Xylanibacter brevis]|uniref:glycosyltransferase n=1 Tax=Xylanibacter brevis TaxID=83231 RepID=UPI000483CA40|nr:glycosyltransferase [Xylanibacter brevis]
MKGLFLATQPILSQGSGISEKIRSQVESLKKAGLDMRFCYQRVENGIFNYYIDNTILYSLGSGIKAHLGLYHNYRPILEYVKKEKIEFVYIRYIQIANPFYNKFLHDVKNAGAVVYLEIPTYPYDGEYTVGVMKKIQKKIEKVYRQRFYKYVDRIVTFVEKDTIFDIPTVRISNGVNMDKIPERKVKEHKGINLVGVAMLSKWHGYDRLIEGIHDYYKNGGTVDVQFFIVGDGGTVLSDYQERIERYELSSHVHFEGVKSGSELDDYFDNADMAIGCLACHRKNVKSVKSLKNVEYAARGIVFCYSEENSDFDNASYVLKIPADETPIDVPKLIDFITNNKETPCEIRKTVVNSLSWDAQMKVVEESIH